MTKKKTELELITAIKEIRSDIDIDFSTYKNNHSLMIFIHPLFGRFERTLSSVLTSKQLYHPMEFNCSISKLRNNTESVIKRIQARNPNLKLDLSTYKGIQFKCKFLDTEIEKEFWAIPNNIISGKTFAHPDTKSKRYKETVLEKYGVDNCSKIEEVKQKKIDASIAKYGTKFTLQAKEVRSKIKATNLERYGVDCPAKNKDIALKGARKLKNSKLLYHWKTKEELICTASYEIAVVNYLNLNKVDFIWQPMVFKLPNGKTYRPDLYLIKSNLYIEIKGYFRKEAFYKWNCFHSSYSNSELWNKEKLISLKII